MIRNAALANGAYGAVVSNHFATGGVGATKLAEALVEATENAKPTFRFLYDLDTSIESKIETIAKEMYGAGSIELSPKAREAAKIYTAKVPLELLNFKQYIKYNDLLIGFRQTSRLHGQDRELTDRRQCH